MLDTIGELTYLHILLRASEPIVDYRLQAKVPRTSVLVSDLRLEVLPMHMFDVIHSAFSHGPFSLTSLICARMQVGERDGKISTIPKKKS